MSSAPREDDGHDVPPGGGDGDVEPILVVKNDHGFPYSKGLLAMSLMAAGVVPARSHMLARLIERRLQEQMVGQITTRDLQDLTEQVLSVEEGEQVVRHFRQMQRLNHLNEPLVVLICGATGIGKSTLATMLANRLGITRVSATDMIRQVLRAFISHDAMPDVHYSSFDANQAVRLDTTAEDPLLAGFARQAEHVAVGIKALVQRAVLEQTSIIVEGIHAVPGAFEGLAELDAVVIEVVVAIEDEELHRSHFYARGESPSRVASRYLDAFDRIRKLQNYMIERARELSVPVIDNSSLDDALGEVMHIVLDTVEQRFEQSG